MEDHQDELYVFTTLRWDPTLPLPSQKSDLPNSTDQFYLFQYHADRLSNAFQSAFSHHAPSNRPPVNSSELVQRLSQAVREWYDTPGNGTAKCLRIKHRIYVDGRTFIECWPIPRLPRSSCFPLALGSPHVSHVEWTLVLDKQATIPSSSTSYKTSDREVYNRARRDADITSLAAQQECLLYDHNEHIMDASITTPYFFRDGVWTTPSAGFGGQQGTTRQWALEHGLAVEAAITIASLQNDEIVWLSNAVRGFFTARFITSGDVDAAITT